MPIDFIWFDLGNTLLHREREKLFAELLEKAGEKRSLGDIDQAYHAIDKQFMREFPGRLGRPAEEFMPHYFNLLCRYLRISGDMISLLNRWMELWKTVENPWLPYPVVPGVLEQLALRGKRLGVISNWDRSAKPILERCGLLDKFEVVVISSEEGVAKPDERIFRIALERAGIEGDCCLYVGDNYYDDSIGAMSVGMKSLIVNRFGTFGVEELSGQRLIVDVSAILPYLDEGGS
ncbi:MAG: HAD-IA family hydrolase [Spirochaetes bacterium]|nr:HAD-IA family hydrolase [Spirochaetota bacterium]